MKPFSEQFKPTNPDSTKSPEDNLLAIQSKIENQQLYKQIQVELKDVSVGEQDRDSEGNLLAPNGKKSNLPEAEWKMTRTPSFLKHFGNWKEKYNKEQYDLWLKFQEKQTCEDYIKNYSAEISDKEKQLPQIHNEYKKSYVDMIALRQEWKIRLSHRVSKLQAELINSGFNIHSYDMDYTKVLDENGEPLLLVRGTNFTPDENGKFVVPKKKYDGKEVEVGVFLGTENEAKHHHEGRKIENKESHLYKGFVNGRNFQVLSHKPNYWDGHSSEVETWKGKYDGLWVKNSPDDKGIQRENDVNLMDYVAFDPNEVLITSVEK